jgi:hypothetical protein
MRTLGWRAYFRDGRTYERVEALPSGGCVCVVEFHPKPYRTIHSGGDWYYFHPDGSVSHSTTGHWGQWKPNTSDEDTVAVQSTTAMKKWMYEKVIAKAFRDKLWP